MGRKVISLIDWKLLTWAVLGGRVSGSPSKIIGQTRETDEKLPEERGLAKIHKESLRLFILLR